MVESYIIQLLPQTKTPLKLIMIYKNNFFLINILKERNTISSYVKSNKKEHLLVTLPFGRSSMQYAIIL